MPSTSHPINRITQLNNHIATFPRHRANMSSQTNNDQFKLESLFSVKGKVALVTGGGSGIGLMCTQALVNNGAKVYITGRTQEKLDRVVESHGKNAAGEIIPLTADISNKDSIKNLYAEFSKRENRYNLTVHLMTVDSCTDHVLQSRHFGEQRRYLHRVDQHRCWFSRGTEEGALRQRVCYIC